eukprot:5162739-Alexandrium_andersonii.AAC.1
MAGPRRPAPEEADAATSPCGVERGDQRGARAGRRAVLGQGQAGCPTAEGPESGVGRLAPVRGEGLQAEEGRRERP